MEVGVKEGYKKKLVRSRPIWAGHVDKFEMKNWQREQMPIKWKGNEDEEDRIAMVDCIKSDTEREWEKNRKNTDR